MSDTLEIEVTQTVKVTTVELLAKWLSTQICTAETHLNGQAIVGTIQEAGFVIRHKDEDDKLQERASKANGLALENQKLATRLHFLEESKKGYELVPGRHITCQEKFDD